MQQHNLDRGDNKSNSNDTEPPEPELSLSIKDIKSFNKAIRKIIPLIKELELSKVKHDKATHDHFRTLIAFLGRISTVLTFEEHRKDILEHLIRCINLPTPKKQKDGQDKRQRKQCGKLIIDEATWSLRTLATVGCALQAIAVMANSDKNGLSLARSYSLPPLLFSKVAGIIMLRTSLIACLAVICGNEGLKKKDKESDDKYEKINKMSKKMEKMAKEKLKQEGKEIPKELAQQENKDEIVEEKFLHTLAKFIFAPIITDHEESNLKAVRAFSLVVQANPKMCSDMLKLRFKEQSNKGEKAKDAIKVRRRAAMTPEEKEMEDEGVLPEPKKEEGISSLEMLLFFCGEPNEKLKLAAAEVLALCSTDNFIRDHIVDSGNATIFFNQLLNPIFMIRAESGLAVSKLAAIGSIELKPEQHEGVLSALTEGLVLYQEQKKAREEKNKIEEKKIKTEKDKENDIFSKYLDLNAKDEIRLECVRHLVESIAYLSMNIKSKSCIISGDGTRFKNLIDLSNESDTAIRYGISQIVYHLTVSSEDLKRNYDKEIEELRKIASKGLPGGGDDKKEELAKKAGSPTVIKGIRRKVVKYGAVNSLMKLWQRYRQDFNEKKNNELEEEKPKKKKKKNKRVLSYEQKKLETDEPIVMSEKVAESVSNALMNMATEPSNRGKMVQEGALQILLHLFQYEKKEIWTDSAIAISRIGITTNPNLLSHGIVYSLVEPLLHIIRTADHELYQFEATLALTNIASIDDAIRNTIIDEKGWIDLQGLLGSENNQVQRAAVECLTNLVSCEKAIKRLRGPAGENDIRFFLIFCRATEDPKAQSAATGALAIISHDEVIAKKIETCVLTSTVYDHSDDEGDEGDEEEAKGRQISKTGLEILQNLRDDPNTNSDIMARVKVCLEGIAAAA